MKFVAKAVPMTRQGLVGFLIANNLDKGMRAKDWTKFARIYDGPSFAKNQYDVKLNVQYWRFASGSALNIELRTVQAALFLLGYAPGKIDGVLGDRTRTAIKGFQTAAGQAVTGDLTGDTCASLFQKAFA